MRIEKYVSVSYILAPAFARIISVYVLFKWIWACYAWHFLIFVNVLS